MKRLTATIACLALTLACLLAAPAFAEEAAATTDPKDSLQLQALPALHVQGTRLVDAQGNTVQLHGVSTHGLTWFPQYVNQPLFNELSHTWGANVVRLAMYTAEYGGYCAGGDQTQLRALVRRGVDAATAAGMYVIVDWHILSDGNPLTHTTEAKQFFSTISRDLASYSNVLYEICNEPNGGTTWADVKAYANQVIPVIRANAPSAVVLVGSPTWSQDIHLAEADRLQFSNVMYTLHFYAATHYDSLRNRMNSCVAAGLPVFVSEFGICDASGNGAIDEANANRWLADMDARGISWCMWSLCNKAESASIIASNCTKTSGFTQSDLTQAGKWVRARLGTYTNTPRPFEPVGTGRFADVPNNHWAETDGTINAADDAGLLTGYTQGQWRMFNPDGPLTRAQAAAVFARMDGVENPQPYPAATTRWTDNKPGQWYTAYINWAEGAGVLHGDSGTTLVRPDDPVSRQELVQMMANFHMAHGGDLSTINEWDVWAYQSQAPVPFDDIWKAGQYAHVSLTWAIRSGILRGSNGHLNPTATCTRAEAAAFFLRFAAYENN